MMKVAFGREMLSKRVLFFVDNFFLGCVKQNQVKNKNKKKEIDFWFCSKYSYFTQSVS